ncbi:hypothetical protein [Streptomyces sp. NPDC057689]|uniref:hypothetical protein n=1 Tax=Streptomyces sp. NPDC057689 TaxID=3346213 RepID=UPI0036852C42
MGEPKKTEPVIKPTDIHATGAEETVNPLKDIHATGEPATTDDIHATSEPAN